MKPNKLLVDAAVAGDRMIKLSRATEKYLNEALEEYARFDRYDRSGEADVGDKARLDRTLDRLKRRIARLEAKEKKV